MAQPSAPTVASKCSQYTPSSSQSLSTCGKAKQSSSITQSRPPDGHGTAAAVVAVLGGCCEGRLLSFFTYGVPVRARAVPVRR